MRPIYDVAIVGSGAGGGMAAYMLTKAGANVILLEAGAPWNAIAVLSHFQQVHGTKTTSKRPFVPS